MSAQASTLHERLLYQVVHHKVEEALNPLFKDSGQLTKEFGAETSAAKLIVLEMIRTAMGEIYLEQKVRIERQAATERDKSGRICRYIPSRELCGNEPTE